MSRQWIDRDDRVHNYASGQQEIAAGPVPRHIAIIMDGNGRWAQKRGLPRTAGHRAGVEALREIVRAASVWGIQVLTVYAFSTENWRRPAGEVNFLMRLFSRYLDQEVDELDANEVAVRFSGDIGGLATVLQRKVLAVQERTAANAGLVLNIAVNYGGRREILHAVRCIGQDLLAGKLTPEEITETVFADRLYTSGLPDPDLLIRTSGDQRLSNFLLWQLAYTEMWWTKALWPDFTPEHLLQAIRAFQGRERRYGGLVTKK